MGGTQQIPIKHGLIRRLRDGYTWKGMFNVFIGIMGAISFFYGMPYFLRYIWEPTRSVFRAVVLLHPSIIQLAKYIMQPTVSLINTVTGDTNFQMSSQTDEFAIDAVEFTLWLLFTSLITFWSANFGLLFIYKNNPPSLEQYRISKRAWPWQRNEKERANYFSLVRKTIALLAFNQLVVTPLLALSSYPLTRKLGLYMNVDSWAFPTPVTAFIQIILCQVVEDFLFYWGHRMLHHRRIYKYIHKVHHSYKDATIGIGAEYAHPLEMILSNLIPTASAPLIVGVNHGATWIIWITWRLLETVNGHSGYDFPFVPFYLLPFATSAGHHDFHHSHNSGNFASFFTWWDGLMGTDVAYLKHVDQFGHVTESSYDTYRIDKLETKQD